MLFFLFFFGFCIIEGCSVFFLGRGSSWVLLACLSVLLSMSVCWVRCEREGLANEMEEMDGCWSFWKRIV